LSYFEVPFEDDIYLVETWSNSSVTGLSFNQTLMKISFSVDGTTGTTGVCNITFPAELLSGDFTVLMDSTLLFLDFDYTESFNSTHHALTINYEHSAHLIEVFGTSAIPELAGWTILPILIFATMSAFALKKRIKKHPKPPES
jgi:hypothetical protein